MSADCQVTGRDWGSPLLAVPSLDEICSGTLYLSVPLLNDMIQVGAGGNLATATIRVSKTPATVTVRRTDGRPIQAQILHEHPGYTGPTVRTKVFDEPVNCLRLQRIGSCDGPRLWLATEAVRVDRHQDLQQFVKTIATFGLAKQREMSGHEKGPNPSPPSKLNAQRHRGQVCAIQPDDLWSIGNDSRFH